MNFTATGVVLSILCMEDDLHRFCRRLSAAVNQGSMHLNSVVATGSQIYPVRVDTIRYSPTLLRCEFRMRHAGHKVSEFDAHALIARVRNCQILDSQFVDEDGNPVGPVQKYSVAS